ncbi:ABC transporter ATP-binding protein [Clostridium estertheticum]|uniref:ABC transporter ATP-binding protein n=1 Tax=Clostridium estertheticum TaxID=238834 RepID=A0A5N7IJN1_9CLOT|nr:ABC transporter ATP-binding protein [Clostridium estertheticum]MBU3071886.1 ABC transporter ATP-binding protein [Clostridium estertheticum]MBU3161978.1 ABC transporter ATP-binding protein [Clostridium estertheticum]MBU3171185.1 ABC transporter ATP-binding protein [Clostridium estertheticum]MBU3183295.1 ABC transporter ATP-binding protein [Clostridium estertheticum]MPQ30510.1 ABC transporter ATP-binding protein [Clostridium estertheticum]
MDILIAKNLSKTYGKGEVKVDALKEVSFSVAKGEFISIVGPSGSGKSTLLNLLGALDSPTSGNVLLDGKDISTMKEKNLSVFRRRNIGFIFQAFNLIPELNVEENILLPLLLDYKKPDMQYIGELLDILGLSSRKHHLPNQLSGGQQQRVAIGRALSTRPAIILADEPTGNLDTKNSKEVINLLKLSVERYNQTLIMITHNSSFASFSDRVLNVEDGIVSELGRFKK